MEALMINENLVREEVFTDINNRFGLEIQSYVPICHGLYNLKWVVTTKTEKLFIKFYHPKRYSLNETNRKRKIERSLFFQKTLHNESNICPAIWCQDHDIIFRTRSNHYYVIMDHFDGIMPQAGQMDIDTIYRLGKTIGRMHSILSRFSADGEVWTPSLTTMKEKWSENLGNALSKDILNEKVIRLLKRQGEILSDLKFSMFDALEPGWAHWDLWVDNMIISNNGKIGIIDFDTVQFGYSEIDVARALLSCALDIDGLNVEAVSAFLKGYRAERSFKKGRLPLALKLLWCREANWWLKSEMDDFSRPPKRFAEEMAWLTDNWTELDFWYEDC